MGKVPTWKNPKWRNRTSDRESNSRFWIGKPSFLFEFPSNHMSISLSFGYIHIWQTDGWTDNADHCHSWPPGCSGPANKFIAAAKVRTYALVSSPQILLTFFLIFFIVCSRHYRSNFSWRLQKRETPYTHQRTDGVLTARACVLHYTQSRAKNPRPSHSPNVRLKILRKHLWLGHTATVDSLMADKWINRLTPCVTAPLDTLV